VAHFHVTHFRWLRYANCYLGKFILSYFGPLELLSLNMAILGMKGTWRNISKLSLDFQIPCVETKPRVSFDWLMSSTKLQLCLEWCRFPMCFLKQKCKLESVSPSWNWQEDPITIFFWMDGVLVKVRNQKLRFCAWSLIAAGSHIITLSLSLVQALTNIKFMTWYCSSIFNSDRVHSLVNVYHWDMVWFHERLHVPIMFLFSQVNVSSDHLMMITSI
jgi:hypothetical protein